MQSSQDVAIEVALKVYKRGDGVGATAARCCDSKKHGAVQAASHREIAL